MLGDDGKLFVSERHRRGGDARAVAARGLADAERVRTGLPDRADDRGAARRRATRRSASASRCCVPRSARRLGLGNLYAAPTGDWFCETARLPRAPKGAGDLLSALFVARRVRGDAPAIALEGATGSVYDVIVRSLAAESEDLLLPEAQDVLVDPVTWPRARHLELA